MADLSTSKPEVAVETKLAKAGSAGRWVAHGAPELSPDGRHTLLLRGLQPQTDYHVRYVAKYTPPLKLDSGPSTDKVFMYKSEPLTFSSISFRTAGEAGVSRPAASAKATPPRARSVPGV